MYNAPLALVQATEELKNMFMDTLFVCLDYRNRAAHGGRIYNFKTDATFRFNKILHRSMGISQADYRNGKGISDLITLTSALNFMDNGTAHCKLIAAMHYFSEKHCSIYPEDQDYLKKYLVIK